MEGYSLNGFSDMIIDYPSQKMLASSYGRGVWEADLAGAYERFLHNEIEIAELKSNEDFRTFRADMPYHLPEYYNYDWMINGEKKGTNSMYFTSKEAKKGDEISCILSVKYSPGIVLKSKALKLKKVKTLAEPEQKRALLGTVASVDLGYFDCFGEDQDFSVGFMLKPLSDGVILGNRRFNDHDAKGWMMCVENDSLVLKYSAKYNPAGGYERRGRTTPCSTDKLRLPLKMGEWNQLIVTFDRDGKVKVYNDGELLAEKVMDSTEAGISLNSLYNLHLFSDASGAHQMRGEIDELKIWQKALGGAEIQSQPEAGLIFHHSFNSGDIKSLEEKFTGQVARVSGNVSFTDR